MRLAAMFLLLLLTVSKQLVHSFKLTETGATRQFFNEVMEIYPPEKEITTETKFTTSGASSDRIPGKR